MKLCISRQITAELSVFYIHNSPISNTNHLGTRCLLLWFQGSGVRALWCGHNNRMSLCQNRTKHTQYSGPMGLVLLVTQFSHEQTQDQIRVSWKYRMSVNASHPRLAENAAVVLLNWIWNLILPSFFSLLIQKVSGAKRSRYFKDPQMSSQEHALLPDYRDSSRHFTPGIRAARYT